MGQIRIDYINARAQASRLEQAAAQCENAEQVIGQLHGQLPDNWQGEAADVFLQEMEQRSRVLRNMQEEAVRLAAFIRRTVEEFEALERRLQAEQT